MARVFDRLKSGLAALLAVSALAACTHTPTAARAPRDFVAPLATPTPLAPPQTQVDPRVTAVLSLTQHLRDSNASADCVLSFRYVKSDGTKAWLKSHYKYEKPRHNAVEIVDASEDKAKGTQLIWTGGSDVQVHTKFIGFWLNVTLPLSDDRLKDPVGYRIDQTAIDKVFDTLLCPANRITYKGDGMMSGRAMTVIDVVSPLSLKPATHEIFGIEKATGVPLMREMYQGDKLYLHMELVSEVLNPHLTSKDFQLP